MCNKSDINICKYIFVCYTYVLYDLHCICYIITLHLCRGCRHEVRASSSLCLLCEGRGGSALTPAPLFSELPLVGLFGLPALQLSSLFLTLHPAHCLIYSLRECASPSLGLLGQVLTTILRLIMTLLTLEAG